MFTNQTVVLFILSGCAFFVCACSGNSQKRGPAKVAHDSHQRHESHRFKDAEKWAKRFDAPNRSQWQKPQEVVSLMKLSVGEKVADLGAGTGYFLSYLSAAVGTTGEVLGLDIEPTMVQYMKERVTQESLANVQVRQVPSMSPGLQTDSVDSVLIVNTWHHLPKRKQYAQELASALTTGGALTIVDFTMDSPFGPPPAQRLTAELVRKELESAGLEVEILDETLPHQYVIRAKQKN